MIVLITQLDDEEGGLILVMSQAPKQGIHCKGSLFVHVVGFGNSSQLPSLALSGRVIGLQVTSLLTQNLAGGSSLLIIQRNHSQIRKKLNKKTAKDTVNPKAFSFTKKCLRDSFKKINKNKNPTTSASEKDSDDGFISHSWYESEGDEDPINKKKRKASFKSSPELSPGEHEDDEQH
ncbi:hypothetical protein DSO57_1021589 [Entomophthora muscae]|uniref:Uncharacterized protein n=1 Tax=Entomophthora muscae TaxID=34485 RepID=A0ACC2TEG5_9FUNG|nr:hypothetical protein DSO57_1021589 [Entomophthora muscae]